MIMPSRKHARLLSTALIGYPSTLRRTPPQLTANENIYTGYSKRRTANENDENNLRSILIADTHTQTDKRMLAFQRLWLLSNRVLDWLCSLSRLDLVIGIRPMVCALHSRSWFGTAACRHVLFEVFCSAIPKVLCDVITSRGLQLVANIQARKRNLTSLSVA